MKRNDNAGSIVGLAIAVAFAVVLIGGLVIYFRQGSVAGVETARDLEDSDFSQLDSTISGL